MANRKSNLTNAFETTLAAELSSVAPSMTLDDPTGLSAPFYLVIEPDSPTQREYVYCDAVSGKIVDLTERYLSGSAAGSGLTHPVGSVVRMAAFAQNITDLHDRADDLQAQLNASGHHGTLGGLADDDHSQYLNTARHDADDHSAVTPAQIGAAPSAQGVTNGNSHDHAGGDGAQIYHGGLGGLADDDHSQYLNAARHDADDHSAVTPAQIGAASADHTHTSDSIVYKTSDESVANTTALQNDNELVFAVGANETWIADFVLLLETAAASAGNFKFDFALPSGATAIVVPVFPASYSGGGNQADIIDLQWYDLSARTIPMPNFAGAQKMTGRFRLIVTVGGTAGNVQLRWAQGSSSSSSISVKAGSHLVAQQVA